MKCKRFLLCVFIYIMVVPVLIFPLSVKASGASLSTDELWEEYQKKFLTLSRIDGNLEVFGVILNPSKWGKGEISRKIFDRLIYEYHIESSKSMDDFLNQHYKEEKDESTGVTNYTMDAELSDFMYSFLQEFVKANSPSYRIFDTTDYRQINANAYQSKEAYEKARTFLTQHSDYIITGFTPGSSGFYVIQPDDILFFAGRNVAFSSYGSTKYHYDLFGFDDNWTQINFNYDCYSMNSVTGEFTLKESGVVNNAWTLFRLISGYSVSSYNKFSISDVDVKTLNFSYKGGQAIMVFDSREDAVEWVTGTRDVYTTDKFNNRQSGTITTFNSNDINNINNSNTYNVINNTVNNYYENGGGFTGDQIQEIIDAIVEALRDSDSGGSGSGSGSGDDKPDNPSGGGLSGFLEGLSKFFDGILAVVGKLLEYLGKAVELLADTVLKVIDIIPTNFSKLLTAIFPFFPHEWITAIELMFVLAVILGILAFFKK